MTSRELDEFMGMADAMVDAANRAAETVRQPKATKAVSVVKEMPATYPQKPQTPQPTYREQFEATLKKATATFAAGIAALAETMTLSKASASELDLAMGVKPTAKPLGAQHSVGCICDGRMTIGWRVRVEYSDGGVNYITPDHGMVGGCSRLPTLFYDLDMARKVVRKERSTIFYPRKRVWCA